MVDHADSRRPEGDALAALAFDCAEQRMAVADAQLIVRRANAAWTRGFGTSVGRSLADILPPELLVQADAAEPVAWQVAQPDGSRWLQGRVRRQGGLVMATVAELPPDEDAAHKAAMMGLDLLLKDAGVAGTCFNPDTDMWSVTYAIKDRSDQHRLSIPRGVIDSCIHPDDFQGAQAAMDELIRDGGQRQYEIRSRMEGAEGWTWTKIMLRAGRRLASGRYEVFSLAQDVTELAVAREEARAKARQLAMALNAAGAGIFEIDHVSQRVECSPQYERIAGNTFDFDFVRRGGYSPGIGEQIRAMNGRWDAAQNHLDVCIPVRGQDRWVRFYCDVTYGAENDPLRVVGLVMDIDQAKRQDLALHAAQEAAEAANEAKSRFLASMSHEIRTPMNGVVGVLHLLKDEQLSSDGRRMLDEALACSGMLSQLIDDVLDFSKIEAGKLEIHREAICVADALDGVTALLRSQAESKGLYLHAGIESELEGVLADPVRLRQCLFNLVGNAVKFTARGGVRVHLLRPAKDRLRVEVDDTGAGIPAEDQARVFQRFEQADRAATRDAGGTGLGLSITRSLVELMGGEIGFSSVEGEGSTFWFEIDAPEAEVAASAPQVHNEGALADLKVLVVDDNATNRLVATAMLQAMGAAPEAVNGGAESVEAMRGSVFDLVLMDVNMPGMDGLQATRLIRAMPGPAAAVPIIALTANVMAHQRAEYIASGMDGAIPKPFSPSVLLQEILRVAAADLAPGRNAAAG